MTDYVRDIPIADIFSDDEFNTRGFIPPTDVVELAKDIDKEGLISPIVLQPWNADGYKFRVVCGHRRLLAHKVLKRETIQAIVRENLSEQAALLMNIRENLHRANLNIMQEANAIARFKKWNWSEARVAEELKVNRKWVNVRFKLLGLHPDIQKRAAAGFLTQHQIDEIADLPTLDEQFARTREIIDWKLKGEKPGETKAQKAAKKAMAKGEPRSKTELFEMQEYIQDLFCDNKHVLARLLAWAAGMISSDEFYMDLEELCNVNNIPFRRPQPKVA